MKFSKTLFTLFCVFSLVCSSVMAQTAEEQNSLNTANQTSSTIQNERDILIGGTDANLNAAASSGGSSTVWVFFRMVFVLLIVVACIYFVMRFMKKKVVGEIKEDDTFLRRVAAVSIGPGKSVQIVTLLEHAYLLGVTDNSIDLLGEIADKELVDAMNLNADRNEATSRARNFSDVLSLFLNPKKKSSDEGKKSGSKISDFFDTQRKKLNSGE